MFVQVSYEVPHKKHPAFGGQFFAGPFPPGMPGWQGFGFRVLGGKVMYKLPLDFGV